jgi:hypothetical protein
LKLKAKMIVYDSYYEEVVIILQRTKGEFIVMPLSDKDGSYWQGEEWLQELTPLMKELF